MKILILALLCLVSVIGSLAQDPGTVNVGFGEDLVPANDSIEIPVNVVPSSGLGLPPDVIQIESGDDAQDPVDQVDHSNPLVNEEVINVGPTDGELVSEEVVDGASDRLDDTFLPGGGALKPEDLPQSPNLTAAAPPPSGGNGSSPVPGTVVIPPGSNGGSGSPNESPKTNPGNSSGKQSDTKPGPTGGTPSGGNGGVHQAAAPGDQVTSEQHVPHPSKTSLWIVLGLLVALDFVLVIIFTILQVNRKKRLADQDRLEFPDVGLTRPAGGWGQQDPVPYAE